MYPETLGKRLGTLTAVGIQTNVLVGCVNVQVLPNEMDADQFCSSQLLCSTRVMYFVR